MTTIAVDTDGVSGDYSGIASALANLPATLLDDYTITLAASTGAIDTTSWNLPSINYNGFTLTIRAATGHEAEKEGINTARYRYGGSQATIRNSDTTYLQNVQFIEGSDFGAMVALTTLPASSFVEVSGCYFSSGAATRSNQGILVNDADVDVEIFNNIVSLPEVNMRIGISITNCNSALIYNNDVEDCTIYGLELQAGTITVKNNAIFNTANDILDNASSTIDYNATDDGDGTNAQTPSDWTAVFNDYPNGDFTLLSTNDLRDNGVGPTTDSNVPTLDIDGDTRSGTTCDIGVDEYQAGGTTYNESITESMTLAETQAVNIEIDVSMSDAINLSELQSAIFQYDGNIIESITLADTVSEGGPVTYNVSVTESLSLSESQTATLTIPVTINESINMDDTLTTILQYAISVVESMELSDAFLSGDLAIGRLCVKITGVNPIITLSANKPDMSISGLKPNVEIEGADCT